MIFFSISKKNILINLIQNSFNNFNIILTLFFYINQDIIFLNNNKNIKSFSQNFTNIDLKVYYYIK